ncbi:class I SAM-dependent methyltransferase [Methylobacterium sp. J-068]|uniref:class I SAM-dependent methyltransferase n=1 Tax=Methylobacterium sp. J-068 TaxID=2836649 RepID=UPI001FB9953D|nr:class I SAM-dependent methyltransferase [Methylobacterium sp. J-068]MCJ2033321.1 class I SAM-dependent methyltransferase [Methylobacterium sp. J-068]
MSASVEREAAHAMDRMYRRQRHLYDASRKFYLLGRDRVIADLDVPAGGSVLEIGCGTGRNLVHIARLYPGTACHGLDVSAAMLDTAARGVARAGLAGRIRLAQGDATAFEPRALFGQAAFDRIVISYALSMIPPWERVLAEAVAHLAPGGRLHVVDFGGQAGLPRPVRALLNRWLAAFAVTPRRTLPEVVAGVASAAGAEARVRQLHAGYAVHARIAR